MQIRGQAYVVRLYQCPQYPMYQRRSRSNKIYSIARAQTVSDGAKSAPFDRPTRIIIPKFDISIRTPR